MLVLARHGQSRANAAGLLVGRADSPLTDLGRRQAEALGVVLAPITRAGCRILSSPLQRAEQTAHAVALGGAIQPAQSSSGSRVITDGRFVELDYGELDQTAISELASGLWDNWRANTTWRPPGGETLAEVMARVTAVCEELAEEAARADVVIVSHVSPIKAAVAWALGAGPELTWRLSLGVASVTRIATDRARGPSLVSFNERSHLAGLC